VLTSFGFGVDIKIIGWQHKPRAVILPQISRQMLYTRSLILTASGYLIGLLSWVIFGGIIIPIISGIPLEGVVDAVPVLMFMHVASGAINFFLIPIYFFVFLFYDYFAQKYLWIKRTTIGIIISCIIFISPFALYNKFMFNGIIWWDFIFSVFGLNLLFTLSAAFFIPQVLFKNIQT